MANTIPAGYDDYKLQNDRDTCCDTYPCRCECNWTPTCCMQCEDDNERADEKKSADYEKGYRDGYKASEQDLNNTSDYDTGYDHGESDRPTLDELMPIDMQKELTNWWA